MLAADLIKKFEGYRSKAYQDQGGIWTVGFGATGKNIGPGTVWTQAQSDAALEHYLVALEQVLRALITAPTTENQFAACMSLAYNIGTAAFGRSSVLRELNAGNTAAAADAFLKWNHVAGVVNQGLSNRRAVERALFLKT